MKTTGRCIEGIENTQIQKDESATALQSQKERKGPMLSIIIPAHNAEDTLARAVRSARELLKAGARERLLEILIVENGSTDRTEEIAAELRLKYITEYPEESIRILHSPKGVSRARNAGLSEAKGDWVTFLDADDELIASGIQEILRETGEGCEHENSLPDVIMGNSERVFGDQPEPMINRREKVLWTGEGISDFEKAVLRPQSGAGFLWGKIFRREFLIKNRLELNAELTMAEDAEFMLRTAHKAKRILFLPVRIYRYYYNKNSAVRRYRPEYPAEYLKTLSDMRENIFACDRQGSLKKSYYGFAVYHLLLTAVNSSFHPESGKSRKEEIEDFRKLVQHPIYRESIPKASLREFSPSRRIVLLLIRLHLYMLVRRAARIRQCQFRSRS